MQALEKNKVRTIVVVLKGYPRLSETFIAQELLGLEQAGIRIIIASLRLPTDTSVHAVHGEIQAPVNYLPEYLHQSPIRVLRSLLICLKKNGFGTSARAFLSDLRKDLTRNRIRRFGQALVLAAEWPEEASWLHAHFIHTPASVAAYTSHLIDVPWTVSAHAKDIWTSPDWDLAIKLSKARWAVTCTRVGQTHLTALASDTTPVYLSYHGLDLERFPAPDSDRAVRDGSTPDEIVTILSVGRAVNKKGFDVLLRALGLLPDELHWQFVHIGNGSELQALKKLSVEIGIDRRISWHGAVEQNQVLEHYRRSDLFVLACRVSDDGDRDGLPNVLVEAASQGLPCITTSVSAIPEFFENENNALLVESENPQSLALAIERAIRSPQLRSALGHSAQAKVRKTLDHRRSISELVTFFQSEWCI